MNPSKIVRLYEWYKSKTFCCAFFAAAMMTMVPPVYRGDLIKSPRYTGGDFMFYTGSYVCAAAAGRRFLFTQ